MSKLQRTTQSVAILVEGSLYRVSINMARRRVVSDSPWAYQPGSDDSSETSDVDPEPDPEQEVDPERAIIHEIRMAIMIRAIRRRAMEAMEAIAVAVEPDPEPPLDDGHIDDPDQEHAAPEGHNHTEGHLESQAGHNTDATTESHWRTEGLFEEL